MIYLDYNATSPYSESVKKFLKEEMLDKWMNPSSEYVEAAALSDEIKSSRAFISESLGCSSKSLIFSSGATESINTVLSPENLNNLGIKNIVSSPLEHPATLDRLKFLDKKGFRVHFIRNDSQGLIDIDEIKEKSKVLKDILFTFLYVNNEIGTINPIKDISKIIHEQGHLIHVDAVQALGKLRFGIEEIEIDFASFSGHKIGALKGIGFTYSEDIRKLSPLLHGGGQERGFRPGTLNYPGIKSLELALTDSLNWNLNRIELLRDQLENKLKLTLNVEINSALGPRVGNTSNFAIPGKNSKEVLSQLARKDIFVSTGSACSSGSFEPSHVIKALDKSKEYASSCIRVSISNSTTIEELNKFIDCLTKL